MVARLPSPLLPAAAMRRTLAAFAPSQAACSARLPEEAPKLMFATLMPWGAHQLMPETMSLK